MYKGVSRMIRRELHQGWHGRAHLLHRIGIHSRKIAGRWSLEHASREWKL